MPNLSGRVAVVATRGAGRGIAEHDGGSDPP